MLADRLRQALAREDGVSEQKMFGGVCFMLNGNMLVCSMSKGGLLVRTGEAGQSAALARPGAGRMRMGEREMDGYVIVDPPPAEDGDLAEWIGIARAFVGAMPPKVKAKKTRRKQGDRES